MPKTLRLTSLSALLDEALHEGLGVRFEDGVDLVEEGVNRGGTGLDLTRRLGGVVVGRRGAGKNLVRNGVFFFL